MSFSDVPNWPKCYFHHEGYCRMEKHMSDLGVRRPHLNPDFATYCLTVEESLMALWNWHHVILPQHYFFPLHCYIFVIHSNYIHLQNSSSWSLCVLKFVYFVCYVPVVNIKPQTVDSLTLTVSLSWVNCYYFQKYLFSVWNALITHFLLQQVALFP